MFIAVRRFEVRDENLTLEEVTDRVRTELLPEFEAIDGFREYFLVDSSQPAVMSITICDTKDALEETNRASQDFVKRAFDKGSVERIDITQGDVLLAPSVLGHM